MVKIYEGRCRGGPLDGKDLVTHEARVYRVVIPKLPDNYAVSNEEAPFDCEHHEYRHVAGQWVWQTRRFGK